MSVFSLLLICHFFIYYYFNRKPTISNIEINVKITGLLSLLDFICNNRRIVT